METTDTMLAVLRASARLGSRGSRESRRVCPTRMTRDRVPAIGVWAALLALAAFGWAVTVFEARSMKQISDISGMPGMSAASPPALLLLAVWVAMMGAMMFPSVGPAATALAAGGPDATRAGRRALVFLAGYLAVWVLFGAGAYLVSLVVPGLGMAGTGLLSSSETAGALVLIFAGVYEWSPLKRLCLEHCRAPFDFLDRDGREDAIDAVRLGVTHGAHCVGCSGGLMLVLLAVGLMNLAWMVALAAVIFAEKVMPHGPVAGRVAGAALAMLGVGLLAAPEAARFLT